MNGQNRTAGSVEFLPAPISVGTILNCEIHFYVNHVKFPRRADQNKVIESSLRTKKCSPRKSIGSSWWRTGINNEQNMKPPEMCNYSNNSYQYNNRKTISLTIEVSKPCATKDVNLIPLPSGRRKFLRSS